MRRRPLPRAAALPVALAFAGCGGDRPLPDRADPGARAVREQNCLACHKIGDAGREATGGDLTRIGAKRSRAQLRATLVRAPQGMPGYDDLPVRDLDAIADYLARRR